MTCSNRARCGKDSALINAAALPGEVQGRPETPLKKVRKTKIYHKMMQVAVSAKAGHFRYVRQCMLQDYCIAGHSVISSLGAVRVAAQVKLSLS